MAIVADVAATVQRVLNQTAKSAATVTRTTVQQRKLKGSASISLLAPGLLRKPATQPEELALTAVELGLSVTFQAVKKWFIPNWSSACGACSH